MAEDSAEGEEERARSSSQPPERPSYLLSPSSSRAIIPTSSPDELSPGDEAKVEPLSPHAVGERQTDSEILRQPQRVEVENGNASFISLPAGNAQAHTHDPTDLRNPGTGYFPPMSQPYAAVAATAEGAEKQQPLGESTRAQIQDSDGILRRDTLLPVVERNEHSLDYIQHHPTTSSLPSPFPSISVNNAVYPDQPISVLAAGQALTGDLQGTDLPEDGEDGKSWGQPFRIQWVRVGGLSFSRTRNLRNPWNGERLIKVSRDGTEVEPSMFP